MFVLYACINVDWVIWYYCYFPFHCNFAKSAKSIHANIFSTFKALLCDKIKMNLQLLLIDLQKSSAQYVHYVLRSLLMIYKGSKRNFLIPLSRWIQIDYVSFGWCSFFCRTKRKKTLKFLSEKREKLKFIMFKKPINQLTNQLKMGFYERLKDKPSKNALYKFSNLYL